MSFPCKVKIAEWSEAIPSTTSPNSGRPDDLIRIRVMRRDKLSAVIFKATLRGCQASCFASSETLVLDTVEGIARHSTGQPEGHGTVLYMAQDAAVQVLFQALYHHSRTPQSPVECAPPPPPAPLLLRPLTLKTDMGAAFTKQMETMAKDIDMTPAVNREWQKHRRTDAAQVCEANARRIAT